MSRFAVKDSNLAMKLNEAASSNAMSEFDLQYSINELASILRRSPSIEKKIQYTAEAVPVFITANDDGRRMYVIEQENLAKLMESQHINVGTALKHIKEALEEQLDDAIEANAMDMEQFSILFRKEDMDQLTTACCEDPAKLDVRVEAVSEYTGFLNEIISEGAKVIFKI